MRLILLDSPDEIRGNFYPMALSHPLWELRCGFSSLGQKLIDKVGVNDVAYFVADYMADSYRAKAESASSPVNPAPPRGGVNDSSSTNPDSKPQVFSKTCLSWTRVSRRKALM